MRTPSVNRLVLLIVLTPSGISCGDVARQGRSPMYLVIDRLEAARGGTSAGEFGGTLFSDVITNVTTPAPCSETNPCPTVFGDSGRVTLRLAPKDLGVADGTDRTDVEQRRDDHSLPRGLQTRRRPECPGR